MSSTRKIISYLGWEWYQTEKFEIEKLIGKMVANGPVPGRGAIKKGTVLYKVGACSSLVCLPCIA